MFKTVAALGASLGVTASLWYWTGTRLATFQSTQTARIQHVQAHQNDALQRILCYLERRTLRSSTIPNATKVQSLHTLDQIDRVGHLAPCENLPTLRHS